MAETLGGAWHNGDETVTAVRARARHNGDATVTKVARGRDARTAGSRNPGRTAAVSGNGA